MVLTLLPDCIVQMYSVFAQEQEKRNLDEVREWNKIHNILNIFIILYVFK